MGALTEYERGRHAAWIAQAILKEGGKIVDFPAGAEFTDFPTPDAVRRRLDAQPNEENREYWEGYLSIWD